MTYRRRSDARTQVDVSRLRRINVFIIVQSCAAVCFCVRQGFKYSGTQAGTWCYCDNAYGRYGPSTGCNATCVGDSLANTTCGGPDANTIVDTGLGQCRPRGSHPYRPRTISATRLSVSASEQTVSAKSNSAKDKFGHIHNRPHVSNLKKRQFRSHIADHIGHIKFGHRQNQLHRSNVNS